VLGVDDWAWRRGRSYGTILCDLELRRPIDLLPERSAEMLAAWLREHPGARVITRDRAGCYAQGAATGAPHATQVADRWHLLHNLRDALKRLADRCHREVREAAKVAAESRQRAPPPPIPQEPTAPASTPLPRQQQQQAARRFRRKERYEQVVRLHREGVSQRAIGKQLRLNRETVHRYIRAGAFPERAQRAYSTLADPFAGYIRQRWEEGCRNAAQITRELKEQGFCGSYCVISRLLARWRQSDSSPSMVKTPSPAAQVVPRQPSATRVVQFLLADPQDLSPEQDSFIDALTTLRPEFKVVAKLSQEFARMLRDRTEDQFDPWIEKTSNKNVPHELRRFAAGLRSDEKAVRAALSLSWSNGQVEGQVNRLKLIKRQMYGRAGFDLLRQRVLHHS
jgi:transposase